MGKTLDFLPVKLFCGIIYNQNVDLSELRELLGSEFSSVDCESERVAFDQTDYYSEEMGTGLTRIFFAFSRLILPDELPEIKLKTNELEEFLSVNSKRRVNLDPGYISTGNVIIATTKNYYHRVPLSKGIYAHIEYLIKKKNISPLEWTYPDFKKEQYLKFFQQLLIKYRLQLKEIQKLRQI